MIGETHSYNLPRGYAWKLADDLTLKNINIDLQNKNVHYCALSLVKNE